jgi:G:T-mismatch repair DNA endonuclease (very short patch repair protein)
MSHIAFLAFMRTSLRTLMRSHGQRRSDGSMPRSGELCLRDQLRNQRLIELGWEVKRFWVYEVRDSVDECVAAVVRWARNAKEAACA